MPYRHIRVNPLTGALGAEVGGVDLAALPEAALAEIRAAWRQHLVLVFRDQPLTGSQYLAFARRIAEPVEYPLLRGLPDDPLIVPVVKQPHERVNFGGLCIPTPPTWTRRRLAPRCWRARFRRSVATRCSRTCIWPTRRCRMACGGCSMA